MGKREQQAGLWEENEKFLVEVKLSSKGGMSKNLVYFQKKIKAKHAFQTVFDMDYVSADCFKHPEPIIVSARTFLTQLV